MVFEINNLINSEYKMLQQLGWLLYGRENQDGGLTTDELERLVDIVSDMAVEKIYTDAYEEGFNDGVGR